MKLQHYSRTDTLGAHNFDCCQIYVGGLLNTSGEIYQGITVAWAGSAGIEMHLPLQNVEALNFADFLESVVFGNVPAKFTVVPQHRGLLNYLLRFHLKFKKIENGAVSYRISIVLQTMWGRIKLSSITACANDIRRLYHASATDDN